MVTTPAVVTADVVMVNVGETVAPAATVTEAGTPTPGSLLVRVTTAPPAGAGLLSVTLLAVVETPPTTEGGDRVTESTVTGLTVRFAPFCTPLYVPAIVAIVLAPTGDVVMVNNADAVAYAGTVTEPGGIALGSLLVRVTTTSWGAGPFNVVTLFSVVEPPPITDEGESTSEKISGLSNNEAVFFAPA
jgi:hypothetical protein